MEDISFVALSLLLICTQFHMKGGGREGFYINEKESCSLNYFHHVIRVSLFANQPKYWLVLKLLVD